MGQGHIDWKQDDQRQSRNGGREAIFQERIEAAALFDPGGWFYEWEKIGQSKVPHHIRLREGEMFAFAGLWKEWKASEWEATALVH